MKHLHSLALYGIQRIVIITNLSSKGDIFKCQKSFVECAKNGLGV